MKNLQTPQTCTKCKSPHIVTKCDVEFFDDREIPLCQNCQNWFNDRSQGVSRDAKSIALFFMNKNIPVQVLDKTGKDDFLNYEIEMNFDLDIKGNETIYATIKPSKSTEKTKVPVMISGKITFLLPNKYEDLFIMEDYMPNEILNIFNKTKGYGY